MIEPSAGRAREGVDAVYRAESRRVLATLIRLLGDFELSVIVGYGGLAFDDAERSLRLFATEVLPTLHTW